MCLPRHYGSRIEHLAYFAREHFRGEWLRQERGARVQDLVLKNCVIRIARHSESRRRVGSLLNLRKVGTARVRRLKLVDHKRSVAGDHREQVVEIVRDPARRFARFAHCRRDGRLGIVPRKTRHLVVLSHSRLSE